MKYLIDTNICIYFIKGMFDLNTKFQTVGTKNIYISEITVAELKFGIANSEKKKDNFKIINQFIEYSNVLPIFPALDIYAEIKTKMRKRGKSIDEFDLLIASTALFNNLILVTNNEKHFNLIENIKIEKWINN